MKKSTIKDAPRTGIFESRNKNEKRIFPKKILLCSKAKRERMEKSATMKSSIQDFDRSKKVSTDKFYFFEFLEKVKGVEQRLNMGQYQLLKQELDYWRNHYPEWISEFEQSNASNEPISAKKHRL